MPTHRSDTFEELARLRERFDALFEELLVRAGLGCAILDAFTALWFAETGGEIRPMTERIDFTFVCVQPRASEASGLAKRFMEAFELEFAALRERCAELEAES